MAASFSSSSKSSNAGDSYIGSFSSLISKYEIRYEGVLYYLNVQDSTIGLKNVRSYGTEGRKKDGLQIPFSDKVYEFILFRGSDIKDLQVKSSPPSQSEEPVYNDPAIIQSLYAGPPLSSSPTTFIGGKTVVESAQGQNTPALTSRTYSGALPSYQSVKYVGSTNLSQATQNAGPSFSTPMYWHGYDGTPVGEPYILQQSLPFHPPSTVSPALPMQNQMPALGLDDSAIMGLTNASECVSFAPSVTSNPLLPNFSPSPTPVPYSTSPNMLSPPFEMTSQPFHTAHIAANRLTMFSCPLSTQETSTSEGQSVAKAVSNPIGLHPTQSMPSSSCVGSICGPFLTQLPSLLSPNQLEQSRPQTLPSMQKVHPDQKDMAHVLPLSSSSPPLLSTPSSQAPLLPLPTSVQQHKFLITQFTEEFDFEAMNEKFNKDEVWGSLGKAKQTDETEGSKENATDQSLENKEVPDLVPNCDAKPAYKKDDFFDMISCNTLSQGRNGQNRSSERKRLNTETFGNFHQRRNIDYGGYGGGRGDNYHGSHNRGQGYGYGGRGRWNMPL